MLCSATVKKPQHIVDLSFNSNEFCGEKITAFNFLTLSSDYSTPTNTHYVDQRGVYVTVFEFLQQTEKEKGDNYNIYFLCHISNALFTCNQYYDILHTLLAHFHRTATIQNAPPPPSLFHQLSDERTLCKREKSHIALHCTNIFIDICICILLCA